MQSLQSFPEAVWYLASCPVKNTFLDFLDLDDPVLSGTDKPSVAWRRGVSEPPADLSEVGRADTCGQVLETSEAASSTDIAEEVGQVGQVGPLVEEQHAAGSCKPCRFSDGTSIHSCSSLRALSCGGFLLHEKNPVPFTRGSSPCARKAASKEFAAPTATCAAVKSLVKIGKRPGGISRSLPCGAAVNKVL